MNETLAQDMLPFVPPVETVAEGPTALAYFHAYIGVLAIAFVVSLVATPIMRRLAITNGVVDRPNDPRKIHKSPIAYLGGVAVFIGIMAGIAYSYAASQYPTSGLIEFNIAPGRMMTPDPVPISILLGMTVIMLLGLIDDVVGIEPRLKIAGQLFAAAALAVQDVGVKVAAGVILPVAEWLGVPTIEIAGQETVGYAITLASEWPIIGSSIAIDLVYWSGTAIIAMCVLGACNASNLIDGLDGLLTGVTAICVGGLLVVALTLSVLEDGPRDGQRIVLCMAVLGACLGFLPHNFNPANIFLGDCGSMLLGFITIVIILSLGDTGKTALVVAGMTMYSIPIIDTVLAIVRRKMAGKKMSDPDSDHLHHMLKRSLGVKGAVFSLYGIGLAFAATGILMTMGRARITYAFAVIFVAYIGVTAIKLARKRQLELAEANPSRPGPVSNSGTASKAGLLGSATRQLSQPLPENLTASPYPTPSDHAETQ
jgi:UDP-GlcNAc:undecaprenyl-phosphate GlcNAc-1-phosphate transferase